MGQEIKVLHICSQNLVNFIMQSIATSKIQLSECGYPFTGRRLTFSAFVSEKPTLQIPDVDIKSQIKLSLFFKNNAFTVMVMHVKDLVSVRMIQSSS